MHASQTEAGAAWPAVGELLLSGGVLALLALAPLAFVTMTSFAKFAVVFGLLRSALGVQGVPPALVVTSLSLLLSLVVMAPVFEAMGEQVTHHEDALQASLDAPGDALRALAEIAEPWRAFLEANAGDAELELFLGILGVEAEAGAMPWTAVVPAFALSELAEAFLFGFLLFLPFLVLDLLVGSILLSLGMHMLSPATVALPFKLLLFVGVGGWMLLSEGLLGSYIIPGGG